MVQKCELVKASSEYRSATFVELGLLLVVEVVLNALARLEIERTIAPSKSQHLEDRTRAVTFLAQERDQVSGDMSRNGWGSLESHIVVAEEVVEASVVTASEVLRAEFLELTIHRQVEVFDEEIGPERVHRLERAFDSVVSILESLGTSGGIRLEVMTRLSLLGERQLLAILCEKSLRGRAARRTESQTL